MLGDNNSHGTKGIGTNKVENENEKIKHIYDTLLIYTLKKNLLSVGKMLEQNYQVVFYKN